MDELESHLVLTRAQMKALMRADSNVPRRAERKALLSQARTERGELFSG